MYTARLLLAHGRLLRRTGNRKDAVERLRQASELYQTLRGRAVDRPGRGGTGGLPPARQPGKQAGAAGADQPGDRGAHLVGKGLSNPEIAAELFISRKAVEYHLGNIYAKCGLHGRQELRRFVEQSRLPEAA